MHQWLPTTTITLCVLLGACGQRWKQESIPGPVKLTSACPMKRGPEGLEFGYEGVRGVYQFVTQDASHKELMEFLANTGKNDFSVAPMTVNLNGKDTLITQSPKALHQQSEVDAEFDLACAMGHGAIYMTHVRYDQPANDGYIRVR